MEKQIVKCSAYGDVEVSTISEALAENRVVKVEQNKDGEFEVTEMCDDYFSVTLTAKQLAEWGRELIELSKQNKG